MLPDGHAIRETPALTIVAELPVPGDSWDTETVEIPARYVVCATCNGRGSHVNPAIDSHGLTAEDFADDPDFRDDYCRGVYDVPCSQCHGHRVVADVDEKMADPDLVRRWHDYQRERAQADADERHALALGY